MLRFQIIVSGLGLDRQDRRRCSHGFFVEVARAELAKGIKAMWKEEC